MTTLPAASVSPSAPDLAPTSPIDLFVLGREASAARRRAFGDRATFARSRRLLPTGAWRGPRDAAEAYVLAGDIDALGGLPAVEPAGVRTLVGARAEFASVPATGLRHLWTLGYRAGEDDGDRRHRLEEVASLARARPPWGVMPTPEGEALGLDTLVFFAACRLAFPHAVHVIADFSTLGPRLAQMCLGFGADELWGPIVSERALRLGSNARNPAMTRKEAALLIMGAGLAACERRGDGTLEEVAP